MIWTLCSYETLYKKFKHQTCKESRCKVKTITFHDTVKHSAFSNLISCGLISPKGVFYDILGKGLFATNIDARDDLSHCKK